MQLKDMSYAEARRIARPRSPHLRSHIAAKPDRPCLDRQRIIRSNGSASMKAIVLLLAALVASQAAAVMRPDTQAVEFYNPTLNHYFVTADAGAVTGSNGGCVLSGAISEVDGYRVFYTGTATATGCADARFNATFPSESNVCGTCRCAARRPANRACPRTSARALPRRPCSSRSGPARRPGRECP